MGGLEGKLAMSSWADLANCGLLPEWRREDTRRMNSGGLNDDRVLVVFGQEDGRCRPVGFGDDVEHHTVSVVIDRKKPVVLLKSDAVFLLVLCRKLAPVAAGVALKRCPDILSIECAQRCAGYRGFTQWKTNRLFLVFHFLSPIVC